MAIALQHLRRNLGRREAQFFANVFFYEGIDVGVGSDSAGNFTDGDFFARRTQTTQIAFRLIVPKEQFQTECGRFRVNAVRPADHFRIFEFHGAAAQYFVERFQVFD